MKEFLVLIAIALAVFVVYTATGIREKVQSMLDEA